MNSLDSISVALLLSLSSALGIQSMPKDLNGWRVEKNWSDNNGVQTASLTSKDTIQACKSNSEGYVQFPAVIHGAHEIFLDGVRILKFSDPMFKNVRSFYGAPILDCKDVIEGKELKWEVYSYSKYFARISEAPKIVSSRPYINVFNELFNVSAAGTLILLSIFSFIISFGKLSDSNGNRTNRLVWSLCGSNLFLSGYFFWCSPSFFNIEKSMLFAHKFADICVWIGLFLFMSTLAYLEVVSKFQMKIFSFLVFLALTIITIASTGDSVQMGTSLPFGMILFMLVYGFISQITILKKTQNLYSGIFKILGLGFWIVSVMNDILLVTGLRGGYVMMSLGSVGGFFFFALAFQEQIITAYQERDFLRTHLEEEVDRKTSQLVLKTQELEETMTTLRHTQAELIQNEKLASLGTLAAGIAHEINNAINFVSGAIPVIEKVIASVDNKKNKELGITLLQSMKNGVDIIIKIVTSLRNHTGLNRGALEQVNIKQVVDSVINLVRTRIGDDVVLDFDIDSKLHLVGSVVSFHQVFMNLITNSIDAIGTHGKLSIKAINSEKYCEITVSDTGMGIPAEIRSKIFDPFFTTKEVGKGTGLGLHIVKGEIKKHRGEIFMLNSEPGKGTTFVIRIPIDLKDLEEAAA